jgi:hypothetical protein
MIDSKTKQKYAKGISKEEVKKLDEEIKALKRLFSPWVFDSSKFTILWTQMQRVATLHPKAKIEYHFYDDNDPILTGQEIYLAPRLPNLANLSDAIKKSLFITPQGMFIYHNDPVTGWGFKRIMGANYAEAAPFATYFAAAGSEKIKKLVKRNNHPFSIKRSLSHDALNQFDTMFEAKGMHPITGLKGLFGNYPELIPSNVTLHLHKYDGVTLENEVGLVKGTGEIDYDYEETLREMVSALCGDDCLAERREYDIALLFRQYKRANEAKVKEVEDFLATPVSVVSGNGTLNDAITALYEQLRPDFSQQLSEAGNSTERDNVLSSSAGEIFFALKELKPILSNPQKSDKEKLDAIQAFKEACHREEPEYMPYLKALGALIIAAIVFSLVFASGVGIALLASVALAAALPVLLGVSGGFSALGLAVGGVLTGSTEAMFEDQVRDGGFLFFKRDQKQVAVEDVMTQARRKYAP